MMSWIRPRLKRALAQVAAVITLLAIGFFLNALYLTEYSVRIFPPSTIEMTYADFIVVLLTAITVLISVLAIVIAILAFVGWQTIGKKVDESTQKFLGEAVADGGSLHDTVKREVRQIMYDDISPVDIEYDASSEDEKDKE